MSYTLDQIREQLTTNKAWQVRVFENQTSDEQASEHTKYHNGVGFTGADAKILSSLAKFYKERRFLTEKQMYIVAKRIPKYARQIKAAIELKEAQNQ